MGVLDGRGETDEFLRKQLRPELLEAACVAAGHPLTLRRHAGYDHSYYFIASLMATTLRIMRNSKKDDVLLLVW